MKMLNLKMMEFSFIDPQGYLRYLINMLRIIYDTLPNMELGKVHMLWMIKMLSIKIINFETWFILIVRLENEDEFLQR